MLTKNDIYLGNPRLKKANVKLDYTEEQIKELARCAKDIRYFCNTYMKIVNVDEGLMNFSTYKFQDLEKLSFLIDDDLSGISDIKNINRIEAFFI